MNIIKLIKKSFFNYIFLYFSDVERYSGWKLEKAGWKLEKKPYNDTNNSIKELSLEKLKTITNKEFLSITPKYRLQYITKENNKSGELKSFDILSFNFKFNWYYNKELWSRTTAWQVLPISVREVISWNKTYKRNWLKWEFFNENNSRLIINQDTEVKITEILDNQSLEKLINENEKKYQEVLNIPKYKDNLDIVKEAIYRNVDIDFAILLCTEKVKWLAIDSKERQIVLEDLFTEFDRIKWGINLIKLFKNGKYPDKFVLKLLKKIYPDWYENIALNYWIESKKIEEFKLHKNTPDYLSEEQQKEIIDSAPEYIVELVKKYFPPEEVNNALLVCHWESWFKKDIPHINSDKYNSTDRWLFQINDHYHWKKYVWENIFDPEVNVRVAYEVFKERNNTWEPWYAAKKIWLA